MNVPLGYVRIYVPTDPSLDVTVMLDEAVPTLTGGVGGWQETSRAKRKSMVEWTGQSLRRLTLPILLDGWINRASVQPLVDALTLMGQTPQGGSHPPSVRVQGMVDGTEVAWFIESDIAWGDELRDESDGTLLRKAAVVSLVEAELGKVLVATKTAGKAAFNARHTVRKGDTLRTISTLYYGTPTKWAAIGRAQSPVIRDPKRALKAGKIIVVPL